MAYTYYRTLTVTGNSALLPSTQTNFAVVVKISHSSLRSAANFGHIQNTVTQASGPAVTMPADLIFTSDSAGTTKIPWEVKAYDAVNGILWAHVLIASCALSTVFYCLYGDSTVSTAQNTGSNSPANVWDTNDKLMWHLGNGTTLNATDSTSSANNGTITVATAIAGQVDGAASFNGSTAWIKSASNVFDPSATDFTVAFWTKVTNFTAGSTFISQLDGTGTGRNWLDVNITTGILRTNLGNVSTNFTGALTAATLTHLVLTKTGTTVRLYINGTIDATSVTATTEAASGVTEIGATKANGTPLLGTMEEVRLSNTLRSANWITALYNSQSAATTFVAIGNELVVGSTIIGTPIQQVQVVASSGTSIAVTITAPTNGNTLAVQVQGNTAGISVSSISQTNVTWTAKIIGSQNRRGPSEIWAAPVTASPGTTVTVNFSGSLSLNTSVWVTEWSGLPSSSYTDQSASNDGSSVTMATGTITPTAGRNILLLSVTRAGNTITAGPTVGFTALTTSNTNLVAGFYVVASATGSYSNSYTATTATWEAQIVDLMAAATASSLVMGGLLLMGGFH